jgi:hypothetical protein
MADETMTKPCLEPSLHPSVATTTTTTTTTTAAAAAAFAHRYPYRLAVSPLHVAGKLNISVFALSHTFHALARRLKDLFPAPTT